MPAKYHHENIIQKIKIKKQINKVALINIFRAPTSVSITWLRMRENDVITGTQQTTLLVTSSRSRIACARTCSVLDWCSVFAADDMARTCELRDLPRISLNFSSKSPYSSRWRLLNGKSWEQGCYVVISLIACVKMMMMMAVVVVVDQETLRRYSS